MYSPRHLIRPIYLFLSGALLLGAFTALNAASPAEAVRMAAGSPQITTPFYDDRRATVAVATTVENSSKLAIEVFVETVLMDADGNEVARSESGVEIEAGQQGSTEQWVNFKRPVIWTPEQPYLYSAKTVLWLGDEVIARSDSSFGIGSTADAEE